jgi:DNA-binding MarR family transcriptional regulator
MRPGDQRVLAFLSRTGEATVSTANVIAETLKLPVATVQESLNRLAAALAIDIYYLRYR